MLEVQEVQARIARRASQNCKETTRLYQGYQTYKSISKLVTRYLYQTAELQTAKIFRTDRTDRADKADMADMNYKADMADMANQKL